MHCENKDLLTTAKHLPQDNASQASPKRARQGEEEGGKRKESGRPAADSNEKKKKQKQKKKKISNNASVNSALESLLNLISDDSFPVFDLKIVLSVIMHLRVDLLALECKDFESKSGGIKRLAFASLHEDEKVHPQLFAFSEATEMLKCDQSTKDAWNLVREAIGSTTWWKNDVLPAVSQCTKAVNKSSITRLKFFQGISQEDKRHGAWNDEIMCEYYVLALTCMVHRHLPERCKLLCDPHEELKRQLRDAGTTLPKEADDDGDGALEQEAQPEQSHRTSSQSSL